MNRTHCFFLMFWAVIFTSSCSLYALVSLIHNTKMCLLFNYYIYIYTTSIKACWYKCLLKIYSDLKHTECLVMYERVVKPLLCHLIYQIHSHCTYVEICNTHLFKYTVLIYSMNLGGIFPFCTQWIQSSALFHFTWMSVPHI
jgi:hypothetical protein